MLVTNPPSATWGRNPETGEHELVIYSAYVTDSDAGPLAPLQTIRLTVRQAVRLAEFITRLWPAEPSPVIHAQPNCEFCAPDMFFTCAECKRTVGWCLGCSDDYPDLCDDCRAKKPDAVV